MKRAIVSFAKDDLRDWFANLTCGHTQHVRHNPPLETREWVTTETGRSDMIAETLDCKRCDALELPYGFEAYSTVSFTDVTVPKKFLSDHAIKAGVWGRLDVKVGSVTFVADNLNLSVHLDLGDSIAIPPELPHYIRVDGAEFSVTFLRPC